MSAPVVDHLAVSSLIHHIGELQVRNCECGMDLRLLRVLASVAGLGQRGLPVTGATGWELALMRAARLIVVMRNEAADVVLDPLAELSKFVQPAAHLSTDPGKLGGTEDQHRHDEHDQQVPRGQEPFHAGERTRRAWWYRRASWRDAIR
jgi:hypothetical protein